MAWDVLVEVSAVEGGPLSATEGDLLVEESEMERSLKGGIKTFQKR